MCSISGFVSSKPLRPEEARALCKALLVYGETRGSQSTGIFTNGKLHKSATNPRSFTCESEFFNLFEGGATYALMHTRQPTCGGRGDEQAQPFASQDLSVVSVHNGYYFDLKKLKETWGIEKPSGVDSELITSFIEKYGIRKLSEFIESSDGPTATAIVYKGKMFLMRSGGPLCWERITLHDGTAVTVFGSTGDMVENAIRHAWIVHNVKPVSIEENYLYRVDDKQIVRLGKQSKGYKSRVMVVGGFHGVHDTEDDWYGIGYDDEWGKDRKRRRSGTYPYRYGAVITGERYNYETRKMDKGWWYKGKFFESQADAEKERDEDKAWDERYEKFKKEKDAKEKVNTNPTLPTTGTVQLPDSMAHLKQSEAVDTPKDEKGAA